MDVIMSEGKGEPTVKLINRVKNSSTSGKHIIPVKQKFQISQHFSQNPLNVEKVACYFLFHSQGSLSVKLQTSSLNSIS
jgi:hypothetical protein